MKFPAWVPAGARAHIGRTLEGDQDGGHWEGINALIKKYRAEGHAYDWAEEEATCYGRFATDLRMRDVYAELEKAFTDDEQYGHFLRAAWGADMDFDRYRERVKKAKELAPQIAVAARKLAELLEQASDAGGGVVPDEFFSIRYLLDRTDSTNHNWHIWPAVRPTITGRENKPQSSPKAENPTSETSREEIRIVAFNKASEVRISPAEERRNMLGYAWEKAPYLAMILNTVARAANEWEPREFGAIGAAIASRKRNPAREYIRAFAKLLRDEYRFPLNRPLFAAMAGAANVVLNEADQVITPDNVRLACGSMPDDSRQNFCGE